MIRLATLTLVLVLVVGCGSTSGKHTAAKTTTTASTTVTVTPADLRTGVAAALDANHRLAVGVLWTDRVPASATQSTRGPALTGMRSSAVERMRSQIRVRMVHETYRISLVRLDPSYTAATAIAQWDQNVAEFHLNGEPDGHAVDLHERARILLHRLGTSSKFVVWKVSLVR